MNINEIISAALAIVALLLGIGLGWFLREKAGRAELQRLRQDFAALEQDSAQKLQQLQHQNEERFAAQVTQHEQNLQLAVRQAEVSAEQASMQVRQELAARTAEFAQLTQRYDQLRKDKQQAEQSANQEQKVLQALAPVSAALGLLQKNVSELEKQRATQHGEILNQLQQAAAGEKALLGTAQRLANAMTSTSGRGQWGEMTLRRIVEECGLISRVDFNEQSNISDGETGGRPDMIIHLPQQRNIAVDSKVPLASLLSENGIAETSSELSGRAALASHAKAVRNHIDRLAEKGYHSKLGSSLEMTVAFIPSDALLAQALEADPLLLEYAYRKQIALVSPTSLWAILKAVAHAWQQNALSEDAEKLFTAGKKLYDNLGVLGGHVSKLGRSLNSLVKDYNKVIGSLESSLVPTLRTINSIDPHALNANAKDLAQLPQVNESARALVKPELQSNSAE
ncbi:MAG: DNA recombination protein RmuC [Microbacteriaceae bacterium]|nr:DNA recombination protein RmuC [Microbacteriaceae bacterium]